MKARKKQILAGYSLSVGRMTNAPCMMVTTLPRGCRAARTRTARAEGEAASRSSAPRPSVFGPHVRVAPSEGVLTHPDTAVKAW